MADGDTTEPETRSVNSGEDTHAGTTPPAETPPVSAPDGGDQDTEQDDSFWEQAVNSLSGDDDAGDTDSDVDDYVDEELPEDPVDDATDSDDSNPDAVDWRAKAEQFDKMQRDTKRDHTKLAQANADIRRELEELKAKQEPGEPEDEFDEDDPATRGDVKSEVERLLEEKLAAEKSAAEEAAIKARQAESDKAFYDGVREKVPDYDDVISKPEFQDWHDQHKHWVDSTVAKHDYDDPSGIVAVVERYKQASAARQSSAKKKGQRLSAAMGPTGRGKPSSSPDGSGDDFMDAVAATRQKVSSTQFTGFI